MNKLRWVFSDIDGVLTDGGMYYSADGESLKRFNTRDGMGFQLLREAGFKLGWLTREISAINQARARKLRIDKLIEGAGDKLSAIREFLKEESLGFEAVAYIGDDIIDLEVMSACLVSGAPADAIPEVLARASYKCRLRGGEGAFREFAEHLLAGRKTNRW